MRSTNHRKYPTRSYRNDYDFVFFGDSSASVLKRNAARFDGEFSATGQIAPAETILSGRAVAIARKGSIHDGPARPPEQVPGASDSDVASQPAFCCRATLFDRVMEFLDRHDQMAARLPSSSSVE
jgi:hypothetical protein